MVFSGMYILLSFGDFPVNRVDTFEFSVNRVHNALDYD